MPIPHVEVIHDANDVSQFDMHISTNTAGQVGWRLNAIHLADANNDADSKYLISVINELNKFTENLKAIADATQINDCAQSLEPSQIQSVLHALDLAEHDLSFLHGARITDLHDENTTWSINNTDTIEAINEALSALGISDNTHSCDCL